MNRYAIIENSLVTNVTVADPEFAISQGWILCTDNVGIGWGYNGTVFSEPIGPSPEEIQTKNKETAKQFLAQTDWATLTDIANGSPMLANQSEFISYRNSIRAIVVNPPTTTVDFNAIPVAVWSVN